MLTIQLGKGGGHEDLFLDLDKIKFKQVADTYFFAIDNSFMKGDESFFKVQLNLMNLLEYWITTIVKLSENEVVFLPFDFSDQYIGCLKVMQINDNELAINYGSTIKYDGTSISPSRFEKFKIVEQDYDVSTESFIAPKSLIIEDIEHSIERLRD